MDLFGFSAEQYTAAATWVAALAATGTLVVLLVTAKAALRQVGEAQALRRSQSRPYVVPSIDIEQQYMLMLCVENVGITPALNVRLEFEEPPRSELREIEEWRMLREPIPTMPPRQKFRAYWDTGPTVFSEKLP